MSSSPICTGNPHSCALVLGSAKLLCFLKRTFRFASPFAPDRPSVLRTVSECRLPCPLAVLRCVSGGGTAFRSAAQAASSQSSRSEVSVHHDLGFYGKKGFERESTRIGDFIPAGPVPLFPQGCPFIPAALSLYSRRAVLLFPRGWRSSPGRHLAPARPAPTAMAGIRAARHAGPRR